MNLTIAKTHTVEHVGLKFLPLLTTLKRDPLAFFAKCQQEHGDLLYAKLPLLRLFIISCPTYAKELLQVHHKSVSRPTLLKKVTKRYGFQGVLSDDGEPWQQARKKLTSRLTTGHLNDQWDSLSAFIEKSVHQGVTLEQQPVLPFFSALSLETVFRFLYDVSEDELGPELIDDFYALQDFAVEDLYTPLTVPLWFPTSRNVKIKRLQKSFFDKLQPAIQKVARTQERSTLEVSEWKPPPT